MACKKEFYENASAGVHIFMDFFNEETNSNMEIIRPIICKRIKFELKHHKGPVKPDYYKEGIPQLWRCTQCKEEIT